MTRKFLTALKDLLFEEEAQEWKLVETNPEGVTELPH
jgi:hypothetical protein